MKKLIAALAFGSLFSTTALAVEAPKLPSVADVTAEANRLIAAVSNQRDACNNQAARLAADVDRLTREIAKAKEEIAARDKALASAAKKPAANKDGAK